MKKIFIVYGILIVLVIILAIFKAGDLLNFLPFNKGTAVVNNQTIKLLIADDDKEKMKGLSKRKNLSQDTGMLFVFKNKNRHAFWMKDMLFPIDIVYISDGVVVDIVPNVQPPKDNSNVLGIKVIKPQSPANYVLEINAGQALKYKIKKGDKITFKDI